MPSIKSWIEHQTRRTRKSIRSAHFVFKLERGDLRLFDPEKFTQWRRRLDAVYADMHELVGMKPYGGRRIKIKSKRGLSVWAYAGNPILWSQSAIPEQISAVNNGGDWSFGIIHEISHDFDSPSWNFDPEFFANLKLIYALEQNPEAIVCTNLSGKAHYLSSDGIPVFYKTDSPGAYVKSFARGIYHNDGMNYVFILIKDHIGWEPFKRTFRYFHNNAGFLAHGSNAKRLNLFIEKLTEYSGCDISRMISPHDRAVYESHLGPSK